MNNTRHFSLLQKSALNVMPLVLWCPMKEVSQATSCRIMTGSLAFCQQGQTHHITDLIKVQKPLGPQEVPARTPATVICSNPILQTGTNRAVCTSFTQHAILLDYNFISALICNKKTSPPAPPFFTPLQVLMFCGMYRTVEIIVYPELTEENEKQNKKEPKQYKEWTPGWKKKQPGCCYVRCYIRLYREHQRTSVRPAQNCSRCPWWRPPVPLLCTCGTSCWALL